MNRENKFRAWDILLNKYRSPGTIQMSLTGKLFILIPNNNSFLVEEIKDLIIEEFTGLKDKNGVDIYEGDIVSHKDYKGYSSEKWEIIFYSGAFWIAGLPRKIRIYNIGDRLNSIEVIGNIYQNPELIIK